MTTFAFPFSPPVVGTAPRCYSWLVAVAEALVYGLGALLIGRAVIDPDVAVRI